jgi:transcriptional regulator with AbiEi antitoxin domain of type IV toxin-antitoxin system
LHGAQLRAVATLFSTRPADAHGGAPARIATFRLVRCDVAVPISLGAQHSGAGTPRASVGEMPSASDYIADLTAHGTYHFTTAEAVAALGESVSRVRAALRRLKEKGEVVDPHRSFHVILPPDHRFGCPPAEQFVPPLMQHLQEPYYVALLSAAERYGAGHEERAFQVMTRMNRKPIYCGSSHVQFVGRKELERTPLLEADTAGGPLPVASPEATALELVGYADQCGGLRHVASVLSQLVGALDPQKLVSVAPLGPIVWTQRLGYLLDLTNHRALANVLVPIVKEMAHDFAPLVRAQRRAGVTRLPRWKLALNASVATV